MVNGVAIGWANFAQNVSLLGIIASNVTMRFLRDKAATVAESVCDRHSTKIADGMAKGSAK